MSDRTFMIMMILSSVIGFVLVVAVGSYMLQKQRKQQTDDDRVVKYAPMPRNFFTEGTWRPMSQMAPSGDKWLPMSQMSNICTSDHIQRMLDEEHVTVTKRVTVGSLNGTGETNMVTVYMRKWPVFGISDHITVMLYGKISLGTNLVSVGMYKDGMWTVADHNEKLLDDDARIGTNRVPVDIKPASAGEG